MNRFSKVMAPGLAMLLSSTPALADHEDAGSGVNVMAGPVFGLSFAGGRTRATVGVEGGVGVGPERLNAGVTQRWASAGQRHELFGYIEIDPWFIIGGTLGVGVGEDSGVQPVLGVWEGIAVPVDGSDGCADGTLVSFSLGYRYTGVHEIYVAPKIGHGSIPCLGGGRPLREGADVLLPKAWALRRWHNRDRAAVAHHWITAARTEASSIPSFVRLAGELAMVAAPSSLIAAAHAAADDEARHTMLCAEVAGGAILAAPPRALPRPSATRDAALARLAVEAWHEGCLGEGIAAAEAAEAATRARDPRARAAQQVIARDEARHAELSWQILAWVWRDAGAAVRDAIAAAIADTRPAAAASAEPGVDLDRLIWHGVPSDPRVAQRSTARAVRRARALVS